MSALQSLHPAHLSMEIMARGQHHTEGGRGDLASLSLSFPIRDGTGGKGKA